MYADYKAEIIIIHVARMWTITGLILDSKLTRMVHHVQFFFTERNVSG